MVAKLVIGGRERVVKGGKCEARGIAGVMEYLPSGSHHVLEVSFDSSFVGRRLPAIDDLHCRALPSRVCDFQPKLPQHSKTLFNA